MVGLYQLKYLTFCAMFGGFYDIYRDQESRLIESGDVGES